MSKKKNTLKELDEFLKQQAATLVSPSRLGDKTEKREVKEANADEIEILPSTEKILADIKALSEQSNSNFRKDFYELIIQTMEAQSKSLPEDKMLINTALYLMHGERWKEAIREYWRSRH